MSWLRSILITEQWSSGTDYEYACEAAGRILAYTQESLRQSKVFPNILVLAHRQLTLRYNR